MGILRTNEISGLETPTPVTGSVLFDGTGDGLRTNASGDLTLGTGAFTIECWFWRQNITDSWGVLVADNLYQNTGGWSFYTNTDDIRFYKGGAQIFAVTEAYNAQTWTHIAVQRDSAGNWSCYINGVDQGVSANDSVNFTDNRICIGTNNYSSGYPNQYNYNGYISNVRILKGTALYTSNFTPPVHELQPIGDTVLLCCNNPDSAGAEATGKTITVNGDAAASTFSPGLTRDFTYGTQFQGVAKFDTQGYFVPPSGNTQNRYTLGLDEIVTDGLVLHLDAGNPFSYPVTGVGTYWNDLSGNNNDGTLNGGVSYTENNRGALVFDGVDDSVTVSDNSSIDFTTDESFTVCCWFYTLTKNGYDVQVGKVSGTTGWIMNTLWSSGDYVDLRFWINNTVTVNYITSKLYLNNWRYVCMQVNRSNSTVYIFEDGVQVASSNIGSVNTSNSGNLIIGTDVFGSIFNGNISQVQIYNKALSAAEVLQNYNALKGRYGYT